MIMVLHVLLCFVYQSKFCLQTIFSNPSIYAGLLRILIAVSLWPFKFQDVFRVSNSLNPLSSFCVLEISNILFAIPVLFRFTLLSLNNPGPIQKPTQMIYDDK